MFEDGDEVGTGDAGSWKACDWKAPGMPWNVPPCTALSLIRPEGGDVAEKMDSRSLSSFKLSSKAEPWPLAALT